MPVKTSWLNYLWKERRPLLLRQVVRMGRLHRTPFRIILRNVLEVCEECDSGYTFPIVASIALKNPELVRLILGFHQEIASHGFEHVNYRYLHLQAQREDILRSLLAFRSLEVPIRGFRAPYNVYTDQTLKLLEEFGFLWEGTLGFRPSYCETSNFFRVQLNGHMSSFICIPMCRWSDDRMIDVYRLSNRQIARLLKQAVKQTKEKQGVIMFDLHPIRIGQPKHIDLLKQIFTYGTELDGWFPTVTEAVEYWLKHGQWKDGASFCGLLTGDIDSVTFLDYLTRLF